MKTSPAAGLLVTTSLLSLTSAIGTLQLDITGKLEVSRSHPLRRRAGTAGTVTAPLSEDSQFIQYYANVKIGTPPQAVTLTVDTGSSDVWAVASSAKICKSLTGCPLGSFDLTKSSTFIDNGAGLFKDQYADGSSTTGDFFKDTFSIGGATVQNFEMGLALDTTLDGGILGISFDTTEGGGTVRYPNLVDVMVNQSVIATQAYSLWLNDLDARSGSLLFGGIDMGKFTGSLSNIAMYPSAETGLIDRFTVAFTSFSITSPSGSDTLTPPNFAEPVVLDSGTTMTYLPDALAQAIFNEVGAIYSTEVQATVCSCGIATVAGTLNFGFAGANGPTIKVPIGEMVLPLLDSSGRQATFSNGAPACLFGIEPASALGGTALLLFGDTVLRSAYVVYDLANYRIGLAPTKFNSTDSNIVPFPSLSAQIPSATTVADEPKVTQTAASRNGNIGPTAVNTVTGSAFRVTPTSALFTGNAGPGFASATAIKKSAAGMGPGAFAWEKLVLVAITMGLMGIGGVAFFL